MGESEMGADWDRGEPISLEELRKLSIFEGMSPTLLEKHQE